MILNEGPLNETPLNSLSQSSPLLAAVDDVIIDLAKNETSDSLNDLMLINDIAENTSTAISIDKINATVLTGAVQVIAVTNGIVDIDSSGNIRFTPAFDYEGPVSFSYSISNADGLQSTAFVSGSVSFKIDGVTIESCYQDPVSSLSQMPTLGTYLGNIDNATIENEAWNGFIGNYEEWGGTGTPPPFYDVRFTLELPEILETEAVEYSCSVEFDAGIIDGQLEIIK